MSWNYRIVKREVSPNEFEFGVYEVFYDDDGNIMGHTENSLTPVVDSVEGLKYELEIMMRAFEFETVDYS